jgi:hypothetical protein
MTDVGLGDLHNNYLGSLSVIYRPEGLIGTIVDCFSIIYTDYHENYTMYNLASTANFDPNYSHHL